MTEKPKLKPGDVVGFWTSRGTRHGLVKSVGRKWVRVEVLGRDPRLKRIKRFLPEDLAVEGDE